MAGYKNAVELRADLIDDGETELAELDDETLETLIKEGEADAARVMKLQTIRQEAIAAGDLDIAELGDGEIEDAIALGEQDAKQVMLTRAVDRLTEAVLGNPLPPGEIGQQLLAVLSDIARGLASPQRPPVVSVPKQAPPIIHVHMPRIKEAFQKVERDEYGEILGTRISYTYADDNGERGNV